MIEKKITARESYRFVPRKQRKHFRVFVTLDTHNFIKAWAEERKCSLSLAIDDIIATPQVQAMKAVRKMDWKDRYLDQKKRGAYVSCELTLGKKPTGGKILDAITGKA